MTGQISRSRRNRKSRCSRGRNPCFPPPFLTRLLGLDQRLDRNDPFPRYCRAIAVDDVRLSKRRKSVLDLDRGRSKGVKASCWSHTPQPWRGWRCRCSCGAGPGRGTRGPRWLSCRHPRWCGSVNLRRPSCCRGPTVVGLSCCPLGARCPIPIRATRTDVLPALVVHL